MFDAAAIATAADAAHNNDTHDAAHAAETAAAHLVRAADPGANDGKKEVVFVDTSLANYQALEAGVRAGVAIVEFDGAADGLAQIAQWAQNNTGYDAIHILSHGSEGMLNLGTTVLDEAALASESVKAELADIGHALNAGGDLLLYGCDVAAGSDGQLFLNDLARLTGADVAASTDATGAADLGGNWTLEAHVGKIETRALSIDSYEGLMEVFVFTASNVPGNTQSLTRVAEGYTLTISADSGSLIGYRVLAGGSGIYSMNGFGADGGTITISAPVGYTFDFTRIYVAFTGQIGNTYLTETRVDGSTYTIPFNQAGSVNFGKGIVKVEISAPLNAALQNLGFANIKQIPVVTDPNISITSTSTGIGGAYKIGDTITAQWNNTASGDNSSGIIAATFDFSQFGGSATVTGTNVNGIWSASYTVTAGNIDAVNRNVTVRASNGSITTTGTDSTNLTIDNIAPTITTGQIALAGATGTGGAYKIGDTVTVTWNNTTAGDNNSDVISGVAVDFSQFGGSTVAATNAGGIWSASYTITAGNIDALNRTASVTVMDNAGNTTAHSSGAVKVDNIVPIVVITSSAASLAGGETATITFNFSEDPGASFTWDGASGDVLVVGGTLSAITGSGLTRTAIFTPASNTNNGNATITVTAGSYADAVGNSSGAAASISLTYDTQAPNAPSAPVMSSASDTGLSNTDNITRNTTPTFIGTAEAGATVILYDTDGTTVLGSTVATGGNWSITASALGQGTHFIQAAAVDAAGNASVRSPGLLATIDTTPPTLAITSNVASLKAGETATITFTFSEDPGTSFTLGDVTVSGGTLSAISGSGLTRTAIFTPTANTNGGTASITVAAGSYTDTAGNAGGAGAVPTLNFDTLAPNAPSAPVMTAASDTGTSSNDNLTRNTTPTFTGTAESGAMVTLYDSDGVTVLGSAVAAGGNWSITTTALSQGVHTITARATDAAGNVGARSAGLVATIDTTAPTVAITSNISSLKSGETATITFTFSEDPGSTFTWNGSSGDIVVSGGTLSAISGTGLTRTAIFAPTANINSGTASITVTAGSYTDAAGNAGGAGTIPALSFDTLAPNAPSAPVMTAASDTGTSSSDNITRNTTPTFTGTAEAGATVILYDTDGITVLGSAVATGGNWSITTSVLGQGTHVLRASAVDAAGNVSTRSPGLVVIIDTTAPTVAIASNAAALKVGETATITFTFSEDPGSTFTWDGSSGDIVVSGGTLSAISGSGLTRTATFTPTPNTNGGTASITVTAGSYTDTAGNTGGAGVTPALSFDTLAPNAPSAPVMTAASDTGTSSSDNITRNTTPTFTGTAEAGATVTLYDSNGTTVLGSAVATGGNWSITATALSEGTHTVTARATDSAGNVGARSTGLAVTIDTAAPTLAITSNVASLKSGETATITFTFSEDPGSTFTWDGSSGDIVVSGGTLSAISGSGLTRTATFTPTANVGGGSASITVAAGSYTDVAGNNGGAGASPALSFNTQVPDAPSAPAMSAGSDTGVSNSDRITTNTTPTFTGTAAAGATVTLYDSDGVTVLGSAVATGGNWSITTSALSEGSHTLHATATDGFGNVSGLSVATVVTIDTTAPTLAITSNVASLKSGETATITFTFSEDPGSTFTWDGSSGDIVVSGGTLSAISGSGLTRTATFTPTANVSSGTASITVGGGSYTDVAGNNGGAGASPALSFNTQVPDAPSAPAMSAGSDTGVSNSDRITTNTTPTFTGTAAAGATVTLYDSDGVTVLGSAVATGGNWSITTSALSEGSHTLHATATDGFGNVSGLSMATVVTIDTTAPTLAITSNVASLKTGETATITFTFSEDPGSTFTWDGSSGDIVVSGGTLSAISGSGLTRTATFTPTPNTNGGTASITVTAGSYTDTAGNTGGAGATPALSFDTLAPSAPSTPVMTAASDTGTSNHDNITRNTTPTFTGTAEAGATVTLYDSDGVTVLGTAVATGGNWSITPTALAEGTHTLTVRATDSAGNIGSASAGLAVTIDTTPPTVSVSSDIANLTVDTTALITFTFSEDPGASFTLGDVTVSGGTLSAISGSGLTRTAVFTPTAGVRNGTASVAVTGGSYTDAAGNNGSGATSDPMTVDTLPPDAPSALALVGGTNNIINSTEPTITGLATPDTLVIVVLSDSNGFTVVGMTISVDGTWSLATSALAEGTHTLLALSIDAAGNVSEVSSGLAITVDTTPPTLAITSNVAAVKAGETATVTFSFSEDPGASFTLGDVTVSGGTLSAISGSGLTRTAIFTPTANTNGGTASITVAAGSYTDTAGNAGGAGTTPALSFDTLAPNAPSAPVMTAASDTGTSNSDNITGNTTPTFTGTAEAGATVTLYDSDGTTVLGSAVATGGNWSITTTALSDGVHTVTARATDVAGNVGARSTGLVATIDTVAPAMAITSNLAALKAGESAIVTFTFSEDPGSTFAWDGSSGDIVVSGGTLSAISGSGLTRTAVFTPTANTNGGTASITVTAGSYTDAAGNAGGAGTTPALSFDTLAPNSPSTPSMTAATDTGISNSDGITRNTTPTLTGTAEAGARVTLYDSNGVTVLGTGVADGSGNWSITVSPLGEGVHAIDASATDSAGNASSRSPALSVTVITTAPPQTVTNVDFSAPAGVSGGTLLTSSTAHTISGTLSAPLGVHQSVEVSLDNGITWSNADATIGGSTWMIDGTLDPAGSTIKVRVADAAGNIGATWSQAYTVDTTAPTVTSVSAPPAGTYALGQNLDFVVRFSETVVVNTAGGIPAITLTLDTGGTVQATYVSGSGTDSLVFRYTVTNNVQDLTGVTVGASLLNNQQVKDIAGNNAIAALNAVGSTAAVNVDGLDPHVVGVSIANGSGAYGAGSTITIVVTYDRVVAVDTFAGMPSFALNSGGVATYASGAGTSTLVFTYTVAAGENAAALDLGGALLLNGGNVADAGGAQANALLALSASLSSHPDIVIDTTPPAVPVIDRIDTSGQQPVLGGTATVTADEHLTVTLGGATYNVTVVNGSWSLDLGSAIPVSGSLSLATGIAYVVAATVTDRAGNSSGASAALQVPVLSAVPPSVLRPAIDRTPAFMPALPVASWFVPQAVAGMDEMPRTISPFARPVWSPDTPAPNDWLFQERDETGARLDDPTVDSKRTLGGGFSVVLLAGDKREVGMVVNHGMRDLSLEAEAHTDFFIPPDAFAHSNPRAAVYLSATQADGKPLPHWLQFNAATGKFTVDARLCTAAQVSIKVVARDNGGKAAAMQFNIRIGDQGANAGGGNNPAGTSLKSGGCLALSEQIQVAAQAHQEPLGAQLARLAATLPWQEA